MSDIPCLTGDKKYELTLVKSINIFDGYKLDFPGKTQDYQTYKSKK